MVTVSTLFEKSIIITGAASGIGAAAARLFAAAGARLTLADVSEESGQALAGELNTAGWTAQFVRTDVSDEAEVAAMVTAAVGRYGTLNGAFNNVGVAYMGKPLHELDREEWDRALAINLTGTFLCLKHEVVAMMASGGGAIVNTGSGASVAGLYHAGENVSSKHGLLGLTRAAAMDYAEHGIRVNAILPGPTKTPLADYIMTQKGETASQPPSLFGRMGTAEEVADAALWLLSEGAGFVTGVGLPIDGGYLVP